MAPDALELMMTEPAHPPVERLVDLAEGRLGAFERSHLERHVSGCTGCSAALRNAASLATPVADARATPDAGMLGRARQLFRHSSSTPATPISARFAGALRFDSATMPPAFGMRGMRETSSRQLLFEAGPFEIELHTNGGRDGWTISGQVLGPTDATTGEVRLIGRRASARSHLSELLEFRLPTVPDGEYQLELQLSAEALLTVGPLELRA